MKKDKKQVKETLFEILCELILTLIFFGIGMFIFSLFGVNLDSPDIDGDLVVLVGIVAFFAIIGISFTLVKWIKKKRK